MVYERCEEAMSVVRSGSDETALDRAARFHQLRGDDTIHVPGHRHQRHHRLAPGALRDRAREEFQIVDRRAGALGDAGHRCGLREIALRFGDLNEPGGEHAAALATQRGDASA